MPTIDRVFSYTHDHHELTWVVRGSVIVEAESARWHLGVTEALWIPAGIAHDVFPQEDSLVLPLTISSAHPSPVARPTTVARTRQLDRAAEIILQPGITLPEERAAAEQTVLALVPQLSHPLAVLELPEDPRAREVADAIITRPDTDLTLEQWARRVHTSSKTLQRSFVNETGRGFVDWRATARLSAALPLLEAGDSVASVAARVGYGTSSGFIQAFQRRFGYTPSRHAPRPERGRQRRSLSR